MGPGLVLAATGVGAGDLVGAAVSASRYGFALVWAAVVGALLKYVLSEGLARWQLATGTTLLEGWALHLGRRVRYVFLAYLVVWSFVVGGALISACGLAAHALVPALGVPAWGIVHSLAAAALVVAGGYERFEGLVKILVGLMFVTLVGSAMFVASPLESAGRSLGEMAVPTGSVRFILSVIGGVGGSVTLLSYGYWMRERGWDGPRWIGMVRLDLAVAYGLTGVFGLAVMVLAAHVLHATGIQVQGSQAVLQIAGMLEPQVGAVGRWVFLLGFWGAVATSMLGVWQGVPYLFCDFVALVQGRTGAVRDAIVSPKSVWYRGFMAWLAVPPMLLLIFERPVGLIVIYSVLGALFMPFLTGTLLYLNSRVDLVGRLRNTRAAIAGLLLCLLLFGSLAVLALGDAWR